MRGGRAGKALPDRAGVDFGRHGPAETERGGEGGHYSERAKRARRDIHRVYGRVGGGRPGEQINKKKGAALTPREPGMNTSERSEHNSGRLASQYTATEGRKQGLIAATA